MQDSLPTQRTDEEFNRCRRRNKSFDSVSKLVDEADRPKQDLKDFRNVINVQNKNSISESEIASQSEEIAGNLSPTSSTQNLPIYSSPQPLTSSMPTLSQVASTDNLFLRNSGEDLQSKMKFNHTSSECETMSDCQS